MLHLVSFLQIREALLQLLDTRELAPTEPW